MCRIRGVEQRFCESIKRSDLALMTTNVGAMDVMSKREPPKAKSDEGLECPWFVRQVKVKECLTGALQ